MDWEPIVQEVSQPCESVRRRAFHLRNHVDGEVEDEDGDSANGFILADPIPAAYIGESTMRGRCNSSGDRTRRGSAEEDGENDLFTCNMCRSRLSLQELAVPVLSCSCLFCKSCFGMYARCMIKEAGFGSGSDLGDSTDEGGGSSSNRSDGIPCPSPFCSGRFPITDIQLLAPEFFSSWEEAASEALVENSDAFVKCPGCQVVIEKVESVLPPGLALSGVPEVDRTVPFTELDDQGRSMSRRAMVDKALNRFRCVLCQLDFCGACLHAPYHLGKTCQELTDERLAIRCMYCDEVCRHRIDSTHEEVIGSIKDIRSQLELEGVDSTWCVEKSDLIAVQRLCDRVCDKKDCKQRLKDACTRNLDCGHHCGGVRGERQCLPCIEETCQQPVQGRSLPSADEYCGICLVESLRSAPSILLQCGHIFHWDCAKKQIHEGYPGPEISFGYLKCPQCKALMKHSSLDPYLHSQLAMMEQIKNKVIKRMKQEGVYEKLKADGSSEETIAYYGLEQYQYYICNKCNAPYFGGKRNCGANLEERRQYDPSELVCGGCSVIGSEGKCRFGHGNEYIEFKCKYCCSVATFFCFGSTHFCDRCHGLWPRLPSIHCRGPSHCPLGVAHSPNGQEYCLGCSLCRSQEQL